MVSSTAAPGPPSEGKGGVWSVCPHYDECVVVVGKTPADVSAGLGSSSVPVGREDRDGALIRPIAPAATLHSHW